jgi:hypothetical protein
MKRTSEQKPKVSANRVSAAVPRRVKAKPSEMRAHYDFDYSKSRPNRFAKRLSEGAVAVVLDPDVATVFQSSESVNAFLRSAITAMPQAESSNKKKRSA